MNKEKYYKYSFSIIMAVYNVEEYLEEAIESIIHQDIGFLDSVEIILVDDGSTDSSGCICDSYQKKYPDNIKVVHKKNGGVSSARNQGILFAEGRYVNFMDSDDKITPGTLSAVYNFFSENDQKIDLVSIPIYFFEGKELPHRLNYKYASKTDQIVDLITQYSYVQMSAASSFFKKSVLSPDFFDTSLRYAEDAKAIMKLFLNNSYYGIVPAGGYLYRYRHTMNSALNGSKLHKEWYLDCLKDYILWSAETALHKFGFVPKFVQFTIMYDLQGRFRMEELPDGVITENEKTEFMELLRKSLSYIDNQIILEQKNLSKEQKDYIISMKESSREPVYEYSDEDAHIRYGETATHPLSSYMLKVKTLEADHKNVQISGSVKLNCKFPYPSEIYIRAVTDDNTSKISCTFEPDPNRTFYFMGKPLAQFTDFEANLSRKFIKKITRLEFCMTCDSHTILFRNLNFENTFPVPKGAKYAYLQSGRLNLKCNKKSLVLEPITLKQSFYHKYHNFREKISPQK